MSGSFNEVIIWAWCLLIISCTSVTINIRVIFSCTTKACELLGIALWQQQTPSLLNYTMQWNLPWNIGYTTLYRNRKMKKKEENWKTKLWINQVRPPPPKTYQAKITNIWFADSNKFPKKSHTLRHHLFFSIKMHHLNRAIRITYN